MSTNSTHTVTAEDVRGLRIHSKKGKNTHKGDNGKALVIAGSSLFHSPGMWAAELLAHFADLVFFYSPQHSNRELLMSTKRDFFNGIVVTAKDLDAYIEESDVILMGPGLMRRQNNPETISLPEPSTIVEIENIKDEGVLTHTLTHHLLSHYPNKKWVIDAGALQELELADCSGSMIYTPHTGEIIRLFPQGFPADVTQVPAGTWLIKDSGRDFIMNNSLRETWICEGGNEGLTKGGTGDLLAALVAAYYLNNPAAHACAAGSYIIKQAADVLYRKVGPYYTTTELLTVLPEVVWNITSEPQG